MSDKNILSTNLFIKPSFLRGVARSVDMYGSLNANRTPLSEETDLKAMKKDWQMVGKNLKEAIQKWQKK